MSVADDASRPFPALAKLVSLLRGIPAVDFAIYRFLPFLRHPKKDGKSPANTSSPGGKAVAAAEPDRRTEREQLIRRRWAETGIKMWSTRLHGAGLAPLNIQGSVELLPPGPGEVGRRYDELEFKLTGGLIACEGVVVDPPK
jgi:hypothetical protein